MTRTVNGTGQALLRNGAAGGQEQAAEALESLARDNAANQVAIVAAGAVDPLIDALVCETDAEEAASFALDALDLASIASRAQILQAENERLRTRVEELEERYERPRQRDRIDVAQ